MSKEAGKKEALKIALEKVKIINLAERSRLLSLNEVNDNKLTIDAFGKRFDIAESNFEITDTINKTAARDDEKILIYHYLLSSTPFFKSDNLISFRNFPGGIFYWEPFVSRTSALLMKKINNNADLLKEKIKNKFIYEELNFGDFSAKIKAVGNIHLTLVFHKGDEEFPPCIDVLFDEYTKYVYQTEDAVNLAGIICMIL